MKRTASILITLSLMVGMLSACSAIPSLSDLSQAVQNAVSQEQNPTGSTQLPVANPVKPAAANTAAPAAVASAHAPAAVVQNIVTTELETALTSLYQQANPAVVYILTSTGSGSGFVYDEDGHIVTNNHVVEGSQQVEVVFSSGERSIADVKGTDADSDLAVLKVEDMPEGIDPLPLGDVNQVQVGQIVVAIGNPYGEQGSMSMGIVSGKGRSLTSQRSGSQDNEQQPDQQNPFGQVPGSMTTSSYSLPEVIQTDAPLNPGNSGGPLLNLAGEVVGVNSAIATESGSNSGVGFSIPATAVERIIPELIAKGSYTYSYMGVAFDNDVSLDEQNAYDLTQTQGAYILQVTAGGPADQAGLQAADIQTGRGGDLIIAIDGVTIQDFGDLNSYLVFNTSPGQTIQLTILRDGKQIELPFTLGARP